jgi:hypothetical protein
MGQGLALDQFHGQEGPTVGQDADFVDRWDAGMLQLPGDLGLRTKAPFQVGVVSVRRQQDLDGQGTVQVGIAGTQDHPHPAATDLALDPVTSRLLGQRRVDWWREGAWYLGQKRFGGRGQGGEGGLDDRVAVREVLAIVSGLGVFAPAEAIVQF